MVVLLVICSHASPHPFSNPSTFSIVPQEFLDTLFFVGFMLGNGILGRAAGAGMGHAHMGSGQRDNVLAVK